MLNVIMLNVNMLSIVMLNVIMLSIVMPNVVAPCWPIKDKHSSLFVMNVNDDFKKVF
jgi:hypothetical protein